jgi:hypothetical protein
MKALTDKIIETLEDRHRHFIGSLETKETIAQSKGYREGLLTAIETIKTLEDSAEFDEVVRVVMKHLANPEKYHPHHRAIIDSTNAELLEGKEGTGQVLDYITD